MSKASDIFNALPFEDRKRLSGYYMEAQIKTLKMEEAQVTA